MKKSYFLIPFVLLFSCAPQSYLSKTFSKRNSSYIPLWNGSSSSISHSVGINESELTASSKSTPSLTLATPLATPVTPQKNHLKLSKEKRKEVRQLLKKEIKSIVEISKSEKKEMSVSSTQANSMDSELKLAAIFGAVGIVGLLLGTVGLFFTIIGAISLIVGTVFFVKWLLEN